MKTGFVASCFDLGPHAGHMAMLKEARENCDYLIVALQTDPTLDRKSKNQPVESVSERYLKLKGCRYVDEIIPYQTESDLLTLLLLLRPKVRFLGTEYKNRPYTGDNIGDSEVYWIERHHDVSSSGLRALIYDAETDRLKKKALEAEACLGGKGSLSSLSDYSGTSPEKWPYPSLAEAFRAQAQVHPHPLEAKVQTLAEALEQSRGPSSSGTHKVSGRKR